jgi:hypothetical protein
VATETSPLATALTPQKLDPVVRAIHDAQARIRAALMLVARAIRSRLSEYSRGSMTASCFARMAWHISVTFGPVPVTAFRSLLSCHFVTKSAILSMTTSSV